MRYVEIAPLDNGGHRNQTTSAVLDLPGWAVIPEDMVCENFPFGEVTAEEIDGVMTVTKWTAGEVPEPEPEPEPDPVPTTEERVTALEEEKELLKAQVAAQSDQMDFYEDCIAEMAAVVYA